MPTVLRLTIENNRLKETRAGESIRCNLIGSSQLLFKVTLYCEDEKQSLLIVTHSLREFMSFSACSFPKGLKCCEERSFGFSTCNGQLVSARRWQNRSLGWRLAKPLALFFNFREQGSQKRAVCRFFISMRWEPLSRDWRKLNCWGSASLPSFLSLSLFFLLFLFHSFSLSLSLPILSHFLHLFFLFFSPSFLSVLCVCVSHSFTFLSLRFQGRLCWPNEKTPKKWLASKCSE